MAVKTDVLLLAESGDVTVARRTAFYTYGKFDVILPEGQEQEETDGRLTDGYIARAHDGNVGRFDFGFIRADATVNIDAGTSDLETQIDSAELRSEGDVFFEGDIGAEGFNGFVPGVDFDTGDIVSVTRWGSRLALPVTDIEYEVSDSGGPRASRVHVSGQLIHDAASRRRSNDEIRQQIAAEKRERLRQVGAVDEKATQAKDTADSAKDVADEAKQATANNRTYIDEQLVLAGAAVEQGRQYLLQMEEHVAAGGAAAGQAQDLAGQAAAAAAEAAQILDQLDPLRDDLVAAHADVTRLHQEASQFTDQAAEHVRQASQHAADAVASASSASAHAADGKQYAADALAHEAEGRLQAGLAAGSASDALQNANRAQQIVDDADGLLSQVQGYSQEAKDALADAESLLGNVDGSGKSLGQVLLEVANLHQETLTAHDDILDLHGEVLEKHGEAIRYVAIAAAQASTAAQHASMAAQEALDVATNAALAASSAADAADDAAAAASSAGQAADEAAQAAENNRQAIGKLQEADGKLQEADQKLQEQIDILEESQELLANAVQILAGAVAQAAMAANEAIKAAQSAGNAAGEALTASQHNSSAIDAMEDAIEARDAAGEAWQATQDAINDEQNVLIDQLKSQQEELARIQSESVNTIMATSAGTNFPGVNTRTSSGGYDWEFTIPDTRGALAKIEYWSGAGATKTLSEVQVGAVSSSGLVIKTYNDRFIQVTWAKPRAIQRSISGLSTTAVTPPQTSWTTVSGISITAGNRASQGYLTVKARWSAANRGSTYGIRLMVNGVAQSSKVTSKLGPLTFLQDGESTFTASFTNVSVPAGQSLQVQVYSTASSDSARRVNRVELSGSWIETA